MTFLRTTGILIAILSLPCHPAAAQEIEKEKVLKLRLAAIGKPRQSVWTKTTKPTEVSLPSQPGEKVETLVIPAGMPIEVEGERFEYLPNVLYFKNRDGSGKEGLKPIGMTQNSPPAQIELSPRSEIEFLLNNTKEGSSEASYRKYISGAIPTGASQILAVAVSNLREKESWKEPQLRIFDTSPEALPKGSLFVFNSTPLSIELSVPLKNGKKSVEIPAKRARILQPAVNESNRTVVIARLLSHDGSSKRQFYYNTLPIQPDGRTYLLVYADPRPNNPNPAGVVMFRDTIETVSEAVQQPEK